MTGCTIETRKPIAEGPDGGWTYWGDVTATCRYRCEGEDRDRETWVVIPDQVAAKPLTYDGLAFPALDGEYVWIDRDACGPDGTELVVRHRNAKFG